jgi:Flp pilus assembly pilin Flp
MVNPVWTWMALKNDRRAVSAIEYSLILSMVAGSLILGIGKLGAAMSGGFSNVGLGL